MTVTKIWYYKEGTNKKPIPVILIRTNYYNECSISIYREVFADGSLSPLQEAIVKDGAILFGLNELEAFSGNKSVLL
jgi:hypothetical protein